MSSTHQIQSRSMTYETFFGLKEKPFSLSSDPKFLYQSRSHAIAYDELLVGIRRREGLLVLTGDIGTGKTTLCRAALQNLDRKTFSAFVPDPFASREDLLKMLLLDFGVMSIHDLATGPLRSASRTELSYLLHAFLETLVPLDAFVVVIIDEAQNMSLPLIEEIRILSDSTGRNSPLQVVFVGQLELHDRLKLPEMRQVDQRVCMYARLDPLSPEAVPSYVRHRLQVAGGSPDRVQFPSDSLDLLYKGSGGVPRLINRICDRALHRAFLRRTATVDPPILEAALEDVGRPALSIASGAPAHMSSLRVLSRPSPDDAEHQARSTGVREWLKRVEVDTQPDHPLDQFGIESILPAMEGLGQPAATGVASDVARCAKVDAELRPEKHLQRLRRQWFKKARMTATWLALVSLVVVGTGYFDSALVDLIDTASLPAVAAKPVLAAPAVPPYTPVDDRAPEVGGGQSYVVEVALFTTSARADRLIDVLTRERFAVYQRPLKLDSGQVLQQVLLGPFASRADAEANLQRLQQTSGYEDARVAESEPHGTTAASG